MIPEAGGGPTGEGGTGAGASPGWAFETIDAFLTELASGSPLPGGGAAAALTGALAAALVGMVCRVAARRDPSAPGRVEVAAAADELGRRLTALMREDVAAYGRVLGVENVKASEQVAGALAVSPGELVTKITRIRLAEEIPVSFEHSFLPLELGRRVAEENLEVSPIFSLFEDKYGIELGEAFYRIEASQATRAVAEALEIERGAPVLAIERTTYSTAGTAVDFEQMFYRGDRIRYTMRLKRRRPAP